MATHDRMHALDAVRGFALIAGVALHSALSFLPGFGELGIPLVDNSPSLTLALIFFVIHMFRMTLFFVIAGFFGRMLLERVGLKAFVGNRAYRILLPLIVFWWIVFPPTLAALMWGAQKLHPDRGLSLPEPPGGRTMLSFPLTHLWFLYVLLWLYAATLLVRWLLQRVMDSSGRWRAGMDGCLRWMMQGPPAIVVLALPLFVSLSLYPQWLPWLGIPTPDRSLIPDRSALIGYSTAFAFGWMLERQKELIKVWEQRWGIHLAIALVCTIACLCLAGFAPRYTSIDDVWRRTAYAACYTVGVWGWTFAVFGIALRTCSNTSPVRRYLADSSYWVYLMHIPLVFLLQVAVMDAPAHWTIKFPFVFGTSMLVLLISYHWLVRATWIGGWLNGRRIPRIAAPTVAAHEKVA